MHGPGQLIGSLNFCQGELELVIDGEPTATFKAGDSFTIPANAVHGGKTGSRTVKLIGTFVVDKTKPIASPAQ